MPRLKSSITAVKEGGEEGREGERGTGGREGERGKGGRGKIGRGRWGKEGGREVSWEGERHSTYSSICERNLKCTPYDARHSLTHILTEVSIDCQL